MKHFFLCTALLWSIAVPAQQFSIEGEVSSPYEGKIYLRYGNTLDSTSVVDKVFSFKGNIPYPMKASLSTNRNIKDTGFFILDSGNLSMDIAIENKRQVYVKSLNGSQTLNEVKNFLIFKGKSAKSPALAPELTSRLEAIIRKNPKSQFAGMLLLEVLSDRDISYKQAQKLYGLIDKKTQDKEDIEKIEVLLSAMSKTQLGSIFPEIEFPSEKGVVKLSEAKKKYTLVYFTASDCITCVEADRQFGELYKEYHRSHGFTIFSVYLESDRNTWVDYLHREGIRWSCGIATKKFRDETIKTLGITTVPANFLLDETGKIIGVNISPKGVHRLLDPEAAAYVPVPKKEKKNAKKANTTNNAKKKK